MFLVCFQQLRDYEDVLGEWADGEFARTEGVIWRVFGALQPTGLPESAGGSPKARCRRHGAATPAGNRDQASTRRASFPSMFEETLLTRET